MPLEDAACPTVLYKGWDSTVRHSLGIEDRLRLHRGLIFQAGDHLTHCKKQTPGRFQPGALTCPATKTIIGSRRSEVNITLRSLPVQRLPASFPTNQRRCGPGKIRT